MMEEEVLKETETNEVLKGPVLTTTTGCPVADNTNVITAGPNGPVCMTVFLLFCFINIVRTFTSLKRSLSSIEKR